MTQISHDLEDLNAFRRAAPGWWRAGVLLLAIFTVSFFIPAVQASLLERYSEGAFSWGPALQWALAGLIVGSFIMVGRARKKKDEGASVFLALYTSSLLVFMVGIFATAFSNQGEVINAARAKEKIERVEAKIGRTTPLGDEIRGAMQSLPVLLANKDLRREIYDASDDPDKVIKILSLAPALGQSHPVIQYAIANGVAKKGSSSLLYRDLVERMRENPELADSPEVLQALSVLAATK